MSPGKAALASPHPGNGHHRQLESGVGGVEEALSSGLCQWGQLPGTKAPFKAPEASALTQAQLGAFRQPGGMSLLPSPLWGPL